MFKSFALTFLLLLFCSCLKAQSTFTSAADGDWDDPSTWTEDSGSNPSDDDSLPDANDHVIIDGHTIDIDFSGSSACDDLTLTNSGVLNFLQDNILSVLGNLSFTGSASITGSSQNHHIKVSGTFDVTSGTASLGGIQLDVTGKTTITTNLSLTSSDGTKHFQDLTIDNSGNIDFTVQERLTINGTLEMSGSSSITGTANNQLIEAEGDFEIPSGTASIGGMRLEVAGTTTITGTLSFTSTTGDKTFGHIVVQSAGTWDNNSVTESFTVSGNITNNGTWNGCSNSTDCTYTLTGNSGTISGTGTTNIPDMTINSPASYTNTGIIVMTDNLTGTGTFINDNGGALTLSDNGNYSISTIDLDNTGNTVTYSGSSNEVITLGPFYDLVIDMSTAGTDCDITALTVNNNLTIERGTLAIETGDDLDVTGILTLTGDGELRLDDGTMDVSNRVVMTGGFFDQNGGTGTITNDLAITGGDFEISNNSPSLSVGSFTAENCNLTIGGSSKAGSFTTTGDFTLNTNAVMDFNAITLNVGDDLNISGSGAIFGPDHTLAEANVTGDIAMSAGTFDHDDGDVVVTGSMLFTGGTMSFNQSSATSTISTSSFSITNSQVTLSEGTVTISTGNLSVAGATGSLTINSTHNLSVSGDLDADEGSITLTNGEVSFVNMDVTSGGAVSIDSPDFTSTGTVTIDNGSLTITNDLGTYSFNNISVNNNGTWTVNDGYDPTISGDITNNGTFSACSSSSCDYTLTSTSGSISGSAAITDLSDLVINGSASYTNTNTGTLHITDRLTGTGEFINGENGNLDYSGNNSGGSRFDITTFTASATGNTVTYSRSGDQRLRAPSGNYYNVVVNTSAAGNDLSLNSNVSIDNQLTLSTGDVRLGTFDLIMGESATISGGNESSYIAITSTSGLLRQNYPSGGNTNTLVFPIGDSNDYSPITGMTINSASYSAGAYVDFYIADSNHPNRNSSNTGSGGDDTGTTASDYISRYWSLTASGISSPDYDISYEYKDIDVVGTESNLVGTLYRVHPVAGILDWLERGTVDPTSNTVILSNADAFGDLYAMDNAINRIPISLISFTGASRPDGIQLEWLTASETNNSLFTLERSTDGSYFEPLAYIPGSGTTEQQSIYDYLDTDVGNSRYYYRLKQTDFNGQFSYSEVILVNGRYQLDLLKGLKKTVFRKGEMLLEWGGNNPDYKLLSLTDFNGRTIELNFTQTGQFLRAYLPFHISGGIYVLRYNNPLSVSSRRILIE